MTDLRSVLDPEQAQTHFLHEVFGSILPRFSTMSGLRFRETYEGTSAIL